MEHMINQFQTCVIAKLEKLSTSVQQELLLHHPHLLHQLIAPGIQWNQILMDQNNIHKTETGAKQFMKKSLINQVSFISMKEVSITMLHGEDWMEPRSQKHKLIGSVQIRATGTWLKEMVYLTNLFQICATVKQIQLLIGAQLLLHHHLDHQPHQLHLLHLHHQNAHGIHLRWTLMVLRMIHKAKSGVKVFTHP